MNIPKRCVRCRNKFELTNNPLAHSFSICFTCREDREETLADQIAEEIYRYQYPDQIDD